MSRTISIITGAEAGLTKNDMYNYRFTIGAESGCTEGDTFESVDLALACRDSFISYFQNEIRWIGEADESEDRKDEMEKEYKEKIETLKKLPGDTYIQISR